MKVAEGSPDLNMKKEKGYTDAALAEVAYADNETLFRFDRGAHRPVLPVLNFDFAGCFAAFFGTIVDEIVDALRAYKWIYGQDCSEMLVEEGIVDHDLGTRNWEGEMKDWLDDHYNDNYCADAACADSDMEDTVNVDQFLANFAVMAVTMSTDSAINNQNNWFMANPGDGTGWAIAQYDHNSIMTASSGVLCEDSCSEHAIYWAITRPGCHENHANQLVGPLLSRANHMATYLAHVRAFTEDVFLDADFLEEVTAMANALNGEVSYDAYFFGVNYANELATDAAAWTSFALLPMIAARGAEVLTQLDALDAGTYPRMPENVGDHEICQDWRLESGASACGANGCDYCTVDGWTVPGFCADDGNCYHGDRDDECDGVVDGATYSGMSYHDDGRPAWCWEIGGVPTKLGRCYDYMAGDADPETMVFDLQDCPGVFAPCVDAAACFSHVNGACATSGSFTAGWDAIVFDATSTCLRKWVRESFQPMRGGGGRDLSTVASHPGSRSPIAPTARRPAYRATRTRGAARSTRRPAAARPRRTTTTRRSRRRRRSPARSRSTA